MPCLTPNITIGTGHIKVAKVPNMGIYKAIILRITFMAASSAPSTRDLVLLVLMKFPSSYVKKERVDPLYSAVNGSRARFLALLIAMVSCL